MEYPICLDRLGNGQIGGPAVWQAITQLQPPNQLATDISAIESDVLLRRSHIIEINNNVALDILPHITPKSCLNPNNVLTQSIYRYGSENLRSSLRLRPVADGFPVAQPQQFPQPLRALGMWSGLSCTLELPTHQSVNWVSGPQSKTELYAGLSANQMNQLLKKEKNRIFCVWMLQNGVGVAMEQLIVDNDGTNIPGREDHVSISVNNMNGLDVVYTDTGNFNITAIDHLPWTNEGLWFKFSANADWPDWFKYDEFKNIKCALDVIIEQCSAHLFMHIMKFVSSVKSIEPSKLVDLFPYLREILYDFSESEEFDPNEHQKMIDKCKLEIRWLTNLYNGTVKFSKMDLELEISNDPVPESSSDILNVEGYAIRKQSPTGSQSYSPLSEFYLERKDKQSVVHFIDSLGKKYTGYTNEEWISKYKTGPYKCIGNSSKKDTKCNNLTSIIYIVDEQIIPLCHKHRHQSMPRPHTVIPAPTYSST